jgi:hypothetical protein
MLSKYDKYIVTVEEEYYGDEHLAVTHNNILYKFESLEQKEQFMKEVIK